MAKRGFTLIELLVVIAIVAILAAILFPVFITAKERGRQARCLANLRQLTLAVRAYADDNDGRTPNPRILTWKPDWAGCVAVRDNCFPEQGQIWPYTKTRGVYKCPTDAGVPAVDCDRLNIDQQRKYPLSYAMNVEFINTTTKRTIAIDTIRRQKHVMLLIHESRGTINDGNFNWHNQDAPTGVHYDGTTIVYCDTHAAWRSAKDINSAIKANVYDPAM